MSLKARHIASAINLTPGANSTHDRNLAATLPVLRTLAEEKKGWKFWLSWGINALLKAIINYLRGKGWDVEDLK